MNVAEKIIQLKKEKNAVILGHYYIEEEIKDVCDYTGDSYGLSRISRDLDNDLIVFAGVRFMGETAKILNPGVKVVLPVKEAGCPMADMVSADEILKMRAEYPDLYVVCYVNSSAEVKAVSDVCVTSRNAADIVSEIPEKFRDILFVPDRNLGQYVAEKTGRRLMLWDGYCYVHDNLSTEEYLSLKEDNPDSLFVVHPECRADISNKADAVSSTTGILDFAKENSGKKVFIGTETGVLSDVKKVNPDVHAVSDRMICEDMKKISMQHIYMSLKEERYEVVLPEKIMKDAFSSLDRMIRMTEMKKN
ncbi:MAG: quinolinate synthase NadA [Candidatus Muiribacteriaceae bacterium]